MKKCMEYRVEDRRPDPNDTAYTWWSYHSGLANPVLIVSTPPAPSNVGPITVFWGKTARRTHWMAGNAPKKRIMSRLIQVRLPHTNKSGYAKSATDKYKLGSRYQQD